MNEATSSFRLAIVGAGIMGLQLAHVCSELGWDISVYEGLSESQYEQSTGFAAGGMLAPYSELESAEACIAELGLQSLRLWPQIIDALGGKPFYRRHGSLLVSHPRDASYFEQLVARIRTQAPAEAWSWVLPAELEIELEGSRFARGMYLPQEAHLDTRDLMRSFLPFLRSRGVNFLFGESVERIEAYKLETRAGSRRFDLVCDCRGIGAAPQLKDLRGVRGEAFLLRAPDVHLERPIRLMHPRYAVYVVPRSHSTYYIGATSIESSSLEALTVRSSLELLSAAFSLHKGFGEATILESLRGVRPAFSDHKPQIRVAPGLIIVNGLYRHGFLLSPLLARQLRLYLEDKSAEIIASLFTFD